MMGRLRTVYRWYNYSVRAVALVMACIAGAALCVMMVTTCVDVVLRKMGSPLPGALDIVTLSGTVAMSCALPYTTAVKGHVSIEYFFHKLSRRSRIVVDTAWRLLAIILFVLLARQCALYGYALNQSGQVTPTLQVPVFWAPWVLAFSCGLVSLIILYNMLHPNKEMIKP